MEKDLDAFRTISEVADDLDIPQHVLRFWEMRFSQIRPMKRTGGRRYYRREDVDLLRGVKYLLYGQGYTIKGVQKILKEQGARTVAACAGPDAQPLVRKEQTISAARARTPIDDRIEPAFAPAEDASAAYADGARLAFPRGPTLAPGHRQILEAILAEIDDCAGILAAAQEG